MKIDPRLMDRMKQQKRTIQILVALVLIELTGMMLGGGYWLLSNHSSRGDGWSGLWGESDTEQVLPSHARSSRFTVDTVNPVESVWSPNGGQPRRKDQISLPYTKRLNGSTE